MRWLPKAALLGIGLGLGSLQAQGLLPEPHWNLRLGGEGDSRRGQNLELSAQLLPTSRTQLRGSLSRSRLETPDTGYASSNLGSLGGEFRLGWLVLGGDVERVVESDQFSATRWRFSPAGEWGGLRVGLDLSRRDIDFERFSFQDVLMTVDTNRYRLTGSSQAKVRAQGVGGSLDYGWGAWHVYAAYTHTTYGDLDFETSLDQLRLNGQLVSRNLFATLADRLVKRLERLGASRTAQNAGLLDESGTLGLDRTLGRWRLGLEWSHTRDHFSGLTANSGSLLVNWDLTLRMNLELRLGQTRSELLGNTQFAGFAMVFRGFRAPKGGNLDWLALP